MTKHQRLLVWLVFAGLALAGICLWGCQTKKSNNEFFAGSSFADMNAAFEEWCEADPNGVVEWEVVVEINGE